MSNEQNDRRGSSQSKDDNVFITTAEAAAMLRLSPRTLEKMRQRGEGPEYFKVRGRVWYTREKVRAYIATTLRRSTFDPPTKPHKDERQNEAETAAEPGSSARSSNSANP